MGKSIEKERHNRRASDKGEACAGGGSEKWMEMGRIGWLEGIDYVR